MNKLCPDVWFLKSQGPKLNHLYEGKTPFDFRVGGERCIPLLFSPAPSMDFLLLCISSTAIQTEEKKKRAQERQFSSVC